MNELDKLKMKLICLIREETKYYDKASIAEAVETLIECVAYLLENIEFEDDEEND